MIGQLGVAFAAGLILNLTPCVLPVIPLKIRIILREVGQGRGRRVLAAGAFLGGSLTLFAGLGVAVALIGLKWGFLFQSRTFVIFLVALLALGGVALIGKLRIPVPQSLQQMHGTGLTDAYLTGALTAVLATPCTGPLLGPVLAVSLTQPPEVALSLFLAIGVGIASPYVVLLAFPGALARMPGTGSWTRRIEEALGWGLIGGALFFGHSLWPGDVIYALWGAWAGVAAAWGIYYLALYRLRPGGWLPAGLATAAVVGVALTMASGRWDSLPWRPYEAENFPQVVRSSQATLVDFTADWCLTCKVVARSVYADERVHRAVTEGDIAAVRVDLTRPVPERESLLDRYGGRALPFVVVVGPDGEIIQRFSGLFEVRELLQAFQRAGGQPT